MFTGLIQSVGRVHLQSQRLRVEGCKPFAPLKIGDSVSVDGVCLTVADFSSDGFIADISEETLNRTTLGLKAERNGFVNLEPALRLSDRLGGHLVSGHIDGLGEVIAIEKLMQSWEIKICWKDVYFSRYLCEKASISLDGISLTVSKCIAEGKEFSIAVIPHTWASTSLKYLSVGDLVNLEADMIAKYSEKLLFKSNSEQKKISPQEISKDWLQQQGWI